MFHPVTAELAVEEHKNRMKEVERKAAQAEALASSASSPAPVTRTFGVRGFVGAFVIRFGVWIQGSTSLSTPVAG
ncbi:MAG: hypothetical protein C4346_15880 [Chloroflexota bacterium]